MNFATAKEAYRYFAVNGFTSQGQRDGIYQCALLELGPIDFMNFVAEIQPEIERGVFLTAPPAFASASANEFLNYMING